jgi:hypothetical protein
MVLICSNNILTIDQFHKNRCTEKKEIINIIIDRKYNKDKNENEPYISKNNNSTYSNSLNSDDNDTNNNQLNNKIFINKR